MELLITHEEIQNRVLELAQQISVDHVQSNNTLPPVMFPVTETVVPVNNVALTLAPPKTLPPVMLPVTETVVPV